MRKNVPDPSDLPSLTQKALNVMMEKHMMYLRGQDGGARAVIQYYDLTALDLSNKNLSHADFTGSTFVDCNMTRSNFASTNFFACDLRNADLSDANLSRTDLRGAYMAGANLSRANMEEADMREGKIMKRGDDGTLTDRKRAGGKGAKTVLSGAKLTQVNMVRVQAQSADFSDADLTGVMLAHANLEKVSFEGANLTDSDLSNSNLTQVNMREAILSGVAMENIEKLGIDVTGAVTDRDMGNKIENLGKSLPELLDDHTAWVKSAGREGRQLDLSGYDLRDVLHLRKFALTAIRAVGANFMSQTLSDAELQSGVFDRSDFRDCNMENADMRGSSFKYARMTRTRFHGAQLCPLYFDNEDETKRMIRTDLSGADLRFASIQNADLRDCILMGADLTRAVLKNCDLRRADLTGAILSGAILINVKLDDAIIDLTAL